MYALFIPEILQAGEVKGLKLHCRICWLYDILHASVMTPMDACMVTEPWRMCRCSRAFRRTLTLPDDVQASD